MREIWYRDNERRYNEIEAAQKQNKNRRLSSEESRKKKCARKVEGEGQRGGGEGAMYL